MTSIYLCKTYRDVIESLFEEAREFNPKLRHHHIADAIGVQKSYFSKVINGSADFNSDQAYSFAVYFKLNEDQTHFFNLLLEFERSALTERKKYLKKQIDEIRQDNLKSERYLESKTVDFETHIDRYFLDPYMQLIHQAFAIPRYASEPDKIREVFNLEKNHFRELVQELERTGFIEKSGKKWVIKKTDWYIPKKNPLYKSWITQQRNLATSQVNSLPLDKFYSVNFLFTTEEETRAYIQDEFLKVIKKLQKKVVNSKPKHIYQMTFDLFSWDH